MIPIYPIFYLLKGDYAKLVGFLMHQKTQQPRLYYLVVYTGVPYFGKLPDLWLKRSISYMVSTQAALTFADVWDFETGLRAVQLRGELMEAT